MMEVETKIKSDNISHVRTRLEKIGATFLGTTIQKDIYFNAPDRDFAQTDEALRLRYASGTVQLTYKGPKQPSASSKAREEINVSVDSGEHFELILMHLGFRRVREVKKTRDQYTWRESTVSLDIVDELGSFVEIEVMTVHDLNDAEQRIDEIKKDLGIEGAHMPDSYLELLLSKE